MSRCPRRPISPVLLLLLGLLAGACAPSIATTVAPGSQSASPIAGASGAGSTAAPTTVPGGTATAAPGSETPSSSDTPGSSGPAPSDLATGCTGSERNKAFFALAAAGIAWDVYCAVLPDGWYFANGNYRLGGGGWLTASYRGPEGAQVSIVEGNICADYGSDVDRCAPRDVVLGAAAMGDRPGELGRLANGLVLDVDRGADPSWRVTGLGLTEDAFRSIAAAFLRVVHN
jgi:hypothetical protein